MLHMSISVFRSSELKSESHVLFVLGSDCEGHDADADETCSDM
jgi:hypothetical protein